VKTKADIEAFLLQAGLPFEEVADGVWVIKGAGSIQQLVLSFTPPILVGRVHVMDAPKENGEECFRTLLELNSEMVHGAYALEGDKVVISGSLQLENLDFNEFQALIDDVTLAVADHYPRLARFRTAA